MESCWVQITSGRGPEECCRAAFHLLRVFSEQATKENIEVDCLEIIHGDAPKTLRSALSNYKFDNPLFYFTNMCYQKA
ncbi:MAG: hypothetical protein D3903_13505 [Candidatus Electrothrix sp. GM3_4]|nr:hypothetical protein [Candidatus Electrothrix sp. GM3_4]